MCFRPFRFVIRAQFHLCYWPLLGFLVFGPPLQASPCTPTDPDGVNPGNLCLAYPTHGMSLDSNTFRQGFASEGYFGAATGPRQPGTPIQSGHIPGTVMDPIRADRRSAGYWSSIEASDGRTTVRTNTGREWTMKVSSP